MPWTDPVAQLGDYVASLRAISRRSPRDGAWTTAAATTRSPVSSRTSTPDPSTWPHLHLDGRRQPRMCALAGAVADGFVAHPTSSHPAVLRESSCRADRRNGEAKHAGGGPQVVVVPRVICGRDESAVATARDDLRAELTFCIPPRRINGRSNSSSCTRSEAASPACPWQGIVGTGRRTHR